MSRLICVWPCGTWCDKNDIEEYNWMSDDFRLVAVGQYTTATTIEIMIQHLV